MVKLLLLPGISAPVKIEIYRFGQLVQAWDVCEIDDKRGNSMTEKELIERRIELKKQLIILTEIEIKVLEQLLADLKK